MSRHISPSQRILSVTPTRLHHLVKRSDAIALLNSYTLAPTACTMLVSCAISYSSATFLGICLACDVRCAWCASTSLWGCSHWPGRGLLLGRVLGWGLVSQRFRPGGVRDLRIVVIRVLTFSALWTIASPIFGECY